MIFSAFQNDDCEESLTIVEQFETLPISVNIIGMGK